MSSLKIQSKLEKYAASSLEDLRDKALAHLRTYPLDHKGAALMLGLKFNIFLELRQEYIEDFKEVENEYYSLLSHLLALKAAGKPLPDEHKDFDKGLAMKILERRLSSEWGNKKTVINQKAAPEPNGFGQKKVEEFLNGNKGKTKVRAEDWQQ